MANSETRTVGQELRELDEIFAGKDMSAAAIGDLCPIYRRVRPVLERLLPILRVLYPSAAKAVELLMQLADRACPQG